MEERIDARHIVLDHPPPDPVVPRETDDDMLELLKGPGYIYYSLGVPRGSRRQWEPCLEVVAHDRNKRSEVFQHRGKRGVVQGAAVGGRGPKYVIERNAQGDGAVDHSLEGPGDFAGFLGQESLEAS